MGRELLIVKWNPAMIVLSYGFSLIGSFVGVTLCEQFRIASVRKVQGIKVTSPYLVLLSMAVVIGGVSIWSMHFVGMTAIQFSRSNGEKVYIRYDILNTILSLIAAIFTAYIGMVICSLDRVYTKTKEEVLDMLVEDARKAGTKITSKFKMMILALFKGVHAILFGGITLAAGVCVMHYDGMVAMTFQGEMEWEIGIVSLSVIIAIIVSIVGLWILFRFLALYPSRELFRLASAVVIAIAVCSMHYTGMYGAKFYYDSSKSVNKAWKLDPESALYIALVFGMAISWIFTSIAITDIRAWHYYQERELKELADAIQKMKTSNGFMDVNNMVSKKSGVNIQKSSPDGKQSSPNPYVSPLAHVKGIFNRAVNPMEQKSQSDFSVDKNGPLPPNRRQRGDDAGVVEIFNLETGRSYTGDVKRQALGIDTWAQARSQPLTVATKQQGNVRRFR